MFTDDNGKGLSGLYDLAQGSAHPPDEALKGSIRRLASPPEGAEKSGEARALACRLDDRGCAYGRVSRRACTAIAPARCGVDPCDRTTVTSATLSPRESASDAAASTSSFR